LMNIAKKLAVVGAIVLVLLAGVKMLFPGLVPLIV